MAILNGFPHFRSFEDIFIDSKITTSPLGHFCERCEGSC